VGTQATIDSKSTWTTRHDGVALSAQRIEDVANRHDVSVRSTLQRVAIQLSGPPKLRVAVARVDDAVPNFETAPTDSPLELTLRPGETVEAKVFVERNDFNGGIDFGKHDAGRNLPHGVYVDNIGIVGFRLLENQNARTFFITADTWVQPTTRLFHMRATAEGGVVSLPVRLRVVEE